MIKSIEKFGNHIDFTKSKAEIISHFESLQISISDFSFRVWSHILILFIPNFSHQLIFSIVIFHGVVSIDISTFSEKINFDLSVWNICKNWSKDKTQGVHHQK